MICACGVDLRDDDFVNERCPVCGVPSPKVRNAETVLNWAVNEAHNAMRPTSWDYLTDSAVWFLVSERHAARVFNQTFEQEVS